MDGAADVSVVRQHVLQRLADGGIHSGAAIAAELGVSRAAVAKQVAGLRESGWGIVTAAGGYRLPPGRLPFDRDALERRLADVTGVVERFDLLESVDSTSSHLARLDPAAEGRVQICLTEDQRAGKGRRGRRWHARPGGSIAFSVAAVLPLPPSALAGLSIAAGVVCAEALASAGVEDVRLKWPNDLMSGGAKLGGILAEIGGEAAGPSRVILGVGVNHDLGGECPDTGQAVTDIVSRVPAKGADRGHVAGELVFATVQLLEDYRDAGLAPYLSRWSAFDDLAGRLVEVDAPGGAVTGTALGVDMAGALRVRTGGRERVFHSGEVSVRQTP